MSATLKQQLQLELFLPNDERLIALVPVFKVPRKRKSSYLCAVCKYAVFCLCFVIAVLFADIMIWLEQ